MSSEESNEMGKNKVGSIHYSASRYKEVSVGIKKCLVHLVGTEELGRKQQEAVSLVALFTRVVKVKKFREEEEESMTYYMRLKDE